MQKQGGRNKIFRTIYTIIESIAHNFKLKNKRPAIYIYIPIHICLIQVNHLLTNKIKFRNRSEINQKINPYAICMEEKPNNCKLRNTVYVVVKNIIKKKKIEK